MFSHFPKWTMTWNILTLWPLPLQAFCCIVHVVHRYKHLTTQESIRLFEEANDLVSAPDNIFAIASIYERIEGSPGDCVGARRSPRSDAPAT